MSWREVDGYLRHLLRAREARPNGKAYRRHMKAAAAYSRRMSEYEKRRTSEYLRGDLSEAELKAKVTPGGSWLQRESARRQLRDRGRRARRDKARTYRGWTIAPHEGVQLGYRIGEGARSRPGKGRKTSGYELTSPPDASGYRTTKIVTSLKAAHAYIDQYEGGS